MLKKKNYKEQQHFSQLHTFTVYAPATATQAPKKYQVYYKRYRKQEQSQNIYNLMNKNTKEQTETETVSPFPVDRTLQLISFDGNLGFLKGFLRKIGKIRQYETGQAIFKNQKIWTAMCVFKFQFDLVKCFRDDLLQNKMDEQSLGNSKAMTEQDREDERQNLIHNHMGKQLSDKVTKLEKMQQDGFQVVTDIYGQYRMDFESNKKFVENLPQIKNQKKKAEKQRKLKEQRRKQAL